MQSPTMLLYMRYIILYYVVYNNCYQRSLSVKTTTLLTLLCGASQRIVHAQDSESRRYIIKFGTIKYIITAESFIPRAAEWFAMPKRDLNVWNWNNTLIKYLIKILYSNNILKIRQDTFRMKAYLLLLVVQPM